MDFDVIKYLEGRKECLRAKASISQKAEPGCIPERCDQARLSEVAELLLILKGLEE